MIGSVLRDRRRAVVVLAVTSVFEMLPALVSGALVAAAVDHGFLAGEPVRGMYLLLAYAVVLCVGAFAARQAVAPTATLVETLRDRVVEGVVRGALYTMVDDDEPGDAATVARVIRQAETLRKTGAGLLMVARTITFTVLAVVIGVGALAPPVLLVLVPCLFTGGVLLVPVTRTWRVRYTRELNAEDRMTTLASRTIDGLRDVLGSAATDRAGDDLCAAVVDHADAQVRVATIGAARIACFAIATRLPLLALLTLGPWLVASGQMSPGALLGAATYLLTGLEPAVRTIVESVGNLGLEFSTVLRRLTALSSAPRPVPVRRRPNSGGIRLEGVTFRYGPHSEPVFNDLSLTIAPGEHLAVVGVSGIGKSTLAALITGIRRAESGRVLVGDEPVDGRQVGVVLVPQEAYLCVGTVRENLTYLAPDDSALSDATLLAATRLLGAESLVDKLGGLDAKVTPAELSPGERQLLVAVRVYLADAEITILDEATCHLDPAAEDVVERAFAAKPGTLIVIAHRITSAMRANSVLLLDGTATSFGTNKTLQAVSPTYADLTGNWAPSASTVSG